MPTRFQIAANADKAQLLAQQDPRAFAQAFIGKCPSLWAETERTIKGEPFTFEGREFWIEPHDVDSPNIVVMTGSQMGKTNLWMNITFHDARYRSRSCFILFPTGGAASDFSSGKFKDAIEGSPQLAAFFTDIDNVGHKRAGSIEFFIRSSSSRRGAMLQVVTADTVVVDEIDRCEQGSVEQALHRRAGILEKRLIRVSTPIMPDSGIDYAYRRSDMRMFFVRCPACNALQTLGFDKNIEWNQTIKDERARWDSARYVCGEAGCRKPWEPALLREMIRSAAEPNSGAGWVPQQKGKDAVGFGGLGQVYSPTVSSAELVEQYEAAEGNETSRAIFIRFADGRPYSSAEAKLSEADVRGARGDHKLESGADQSFLGLDVGPPHWAFIAQYTNGDSGPCKVIWMGKLAKMEEADALMSQFHVSMAVVDAAPEREKAQEFAERHRGKVYLAFYPWDAKMKATASWNEKESTVNLHRTYWIDRIVGRFRNRSFSLPSDVPDAWLAHFSNIARVEEPDNHGNLVAKWVEARAGLPDHFMHAAVYCEAAAAKLGRPFSWDLDPDPSFIERGYDTGKSYIELEEDWSEGYSL